MALPHPQSRQDNSRKEDKPNSGGVLGDLFERTIDIAQYWNRKDQVNPAKNRAFSAMCHDVGSSPRSAAGRAITAASCLNILAQPYSAPLTACSPNGWETSKPECSKK